MSDPEHAEPPQNLDAEESVLGALLQAGASGAEASRRAVESVRSTGLDPEDFYFERRHGALYETLLTLTDRGEPIEAPLVAAELERTGKLKDIGGRGRIGELAALAPATVNAADYARIVKARARDRGLIRQLGPLLEEARNGGIVDSAIALLAIEKAREVVAEAGAVAPLERLTARALCALPDPPDTAELLGPLVMRGQRTIIGGHTGEGKTTLALQLVGAIVGGSDFLGWTGNGARALVLDAEQGLRSVKRRLREAGLDECDAVDYVRQPDGLSLDSDPRDAAALEAILAEGAYDVVAADPLYKLHRGDSNDEREAVDLMRRFDGWRERYGFGLILPVHCRKPLPGTKFSIHDLFGSSAYVRGAEVVLGLQLVSNGYSKLHFLKDRDGDLPIGDRWGLLFDREEGFRRDPKDGEKRETALDKVRAALEADPTLTPKALEAATGCAERTVRDALRKLREEHTLTLLEEAKPE